MSPTGRAAGQLSIAFVIARFPPAIGGTERQAASLAGRLRAAGHRVTVYTQRLSPAPTALQENVVSLGPRSGSRLRSAAFGLGLLPRLMTAKPDIIQAFLLSSPALFAGLAGWITGRPVVAKLGASGEFGDLSTSRARRSSRLRLQAVLRLVDHFVAPSAETMAEIASLGVAPDRLSLIPNGVDLLAFGPGAPAGDRDPQTVIFAGRLEAQKDPWTLLRAWSRVAAARPGARLLLIGEGSLGPSLEQGAREAGLAGSITFAGPVPHDRMPGWYARGGIFVFGSRSEGMSNALLEAMACGLAPVVSDIRANREVCGEAARFFAPGDPASLADALLEVLGDGSFARRLSAMASARSRAFSLETAAAAYESLYRNLAGGRVPGRPSRR